MPDENGYNTSSLVAKLYDIATRNMENSGGVMPFSKDLAVYMEDEAEDAPLDLLKAYSASREGWIDILYYKLLHRFPEPGLIEKRITEGESMTDREFKKWTFDKIFSSPEYKQKKPITIVKNNIFNAQ